MPLQVVRRCAAMHMRPPLSHRVHFGGGWIPALPGHACKARVGPIRASIAAAVPLSEEKEPAKGEDGTPWFANISTGKIFGLFLKGVVAMACVGALVFLCHLGITHYHSVSYIASICIISLFYYAFVFIL